MSPDVRRAAAACLLPGALWLAACGDATRSDEATRAALDAADAAGRGPYDALQVETDLMVEMRDGIRLATDVYRPSREYEPVEGPFPVLLHRTPYDKTSRGLVDQARWFATHGYVVVLQDTRGLYASEGTFQKYHEFDAPDGYDTIEWITGLDYAEPSVGMWGTSYGAHTQADAAKLDPPGLRTLVLTMGGLSDAWTHKVRNHGALELGQQLGWAHLQLAAVADDPEIRLRLAEEPPSDWFPDTPFQKGENPLAAAPNFEDYYLTMQNHGDYDDYFRGIGRNWVEYYDETSDIPMLHVGGWYDSYAPGTIQSFVELSRRKSSPMTLLMGPWTHGGNSRSHAGDIEFGAEAAVEDFSREFHLRWFDRHLRGQSGNDLFESDVRLAGEAAGPVTIFVMGGGDGRRDENGRLFHGGEWRTAQSWPLEGTEATPFHLRAGGGLTREPPGRDEGSTAYTYDPAHPVPTIGGAFSGALKRGGYDQRERTFRSLEGGSENGFFASEVDGRRTADRPDVLVFETGPLAEDLEVIGPVTVTLWISSSAPDTDFTAKLVDVYPPNDDVPDGFDLNITDGILRTRYRDSREHETLMTPGEVYELEIRLFPTANLFRAGHRIRLEISSSNYPRFDVNPNTGEPLGRHTRMVPAENTIHHAADRPSAIHLPLQRR
ncbi:MAG: CocE/NonD family hydrolase [Gemmatimonadota bacterium]|uniref:CocE/NonD family hydrolase n=1 Tax=Candidatus Palauibacter scopulicola TaxID=3056741 RepID=UPI0023A74FFA|nr:CocE/NonD family hydrolase [Candidatus Palauibacter scopulicola]MDE2663458.1 CocE/NonD family hydrolase [Candidatus Palauibacter scopulicola]